METMHFPERLQIETFHGCNARCTMCSISDWQRPKAEMSDAVFSKILEDVDPFLPHLQVTSLIMLGEALLGRQIFDRVKRAKERGLPNIGFACNGGLMTEERAQKLMDAGLDWISFSFDSLNKEVYEAHRVRLKFDRVLNNIINFIEIRNKGNYPTRVNIRYLDHLVGNVQFAEFADAEFKKYKDFWDGRLKDRDQIHYGRVYDWERNEMALYEDGMSCSYALNHMVIFDDGTVPLCCADHNATMKFGNVLENSLLDIWNSPKWREVRDLHNRNEGEKIKICSGCDLPAYEKQRELNTVDAV